MGRHDERGLARGHADRLEALAVEAMRELEARNASLEDRIARLEAALAATGKGD